MLRSRCKDVKAKTCFLLFSLFLYEKELEPVKKKNLELELASQKRTGSATLFFLYIFPYYWKCFYSTSLYFRWQWRAHRPGQPSSTAPAQGTRREVQKEEGPPKQGTPGGGQRLGGGHWRCRHPRRPRQMEPGWYWACRVPASSLCQEGHEHHRQGAAGGPLHPPGVLQVVSAGQLCGGGNKWYICL